MTPEGPNPSARPLRRGAQLALSALFVVTDLLLIGAGSPGRVAGKPMSRVRFTVRRMMAGVAVAAVVCFVGVSLMRRSEAASLARQEANLLMWAEQYDLQVRELRGTAEGDEDASPEATSRLADELKAAAEDARRRARHIRRKRLRCERAARRPWLSVAPDLPESK